MNCMDGDRRHPFLRSARPTYRWSTQKFASVTCPGTRQGRFVWVPSFRVGAAEPPSDLVIKTHEKKKPSRPMHGLHMPKNLCRMNPISPGIPCTLCRFSHVIFDTRNSETTPSSGCDCSSTTRRWGWLVRYLLLTFIARVSDEGLPRTNPPVRSPFPPVLLQMKYTAATILCLLTAGCSAFSPRGFVSSSKSGLLVPSSSEGSSVPLFTRPNMVAGGAERAAGQEYYEGT